MTPIERGKALALLSVGLSIGEVARRMGRAKSSIFKLKEKKNRGDSVRACQASPGGGRRNLASLGDVKRIIRMVKASPFITAKKIKDQMGEAGVRFSPRRIREILQRAGYSTKHAAKKPLLTDRMKAQRMEFATSHLHWTPEDWCKNLWSIFKGKLEGIHLTSIPALQGLLLG